MARTGSFINHLADNSTTEMKPEVGMAATLIHWSDRTPLTVIEVSKTGHRIVAQEDTATRVDGRGMTDAQEYEYERDPNGRTFEATRRRDGSYRLKGQSTRIVLGSRNKYHDFTF